MKPAWRSARRLERRLAAPFVDVEVAVSDFMRAEVAQAPHARRVERIHNGIDVARFAPRERRGDERCVIGCATRLVPGKGVETLMRAFERLPHARLRIAGHGPERERLAAAAPDGVEFAGVVHDMASFWADVDVAVMPSRLPESFGMAALEAMAAGKPVIATRCGGVAELVEDGVNGRLVPIDDEAELVAALRSYLDDPALRRAHGAAGRARAERDFSIESCARAYAGLFAELSGRTAVAPARALEEVHV
jgi:glycosyltransferase involved in cell wall biosynthesis